MCLISKLVSPPRVGEKKNSTPGPGFWSRCPLVPQRSIWWSGNGCRCVSYVHDTDAPWWAQLQIDCWKITWLQIRKCQKVGKWGYEAIRPPWPCKFIRKTCFSFCILFLPFSSFGQFQRRKKVRKRTPLDPLGQRRHKASLSALSHFCYPLSSFFPLQMSSFALRYSYFAWGALFYSPYSLIWQFQKSQKYI